MRALGKKIKTNVSVLYILARKRQGCAELRQCPLSVCGVLCYNGYDHPTAGLSGVIKTSPQTSDRSHLFDML